MKNLEKRLKALEKNQNKLQAVSISRRDLNQLQVHIDDRFKKLHEKLMETVNTMKNQLIQISALISGHDDDNEVMAQIDMLKKRKE